MDESEQARSFPSAQEFSHVMGQAVWLMSISATYKDRPIKEIEQVVTTPLVLKQFKLYAKHKRLAVRIKRDHRGLRFSVYSGC